MRTQNRVLVKYKKVEYIPKDNDMDENTIYISDQYGISVHKCICGCKTITAMPLGENEWSYQIDTNNNISMQPSVGNYQFPCKSHYIFYKGGANFV